LGGIGIVNPSAGCFLCFPNTQKQPAYCKGRLKAAFQQNFQTILGIFEHGNTKNSSRKSDSRIRYVRHNGLSDINIRPTTAVLNKLPIML
jgi:hypothetical protein